MLDVVVTPGTTVLAHHQRRWTEHTSLQVPQKGTPTNAYQDSRRFIIIPLYLGVRFSWHLYDSIGPRQNHFNKFLHHLAEGKEL